MGVLVRLLDLSRPFVGRFSGLPGGLGCFAVYQRVLILRLQSYLCRCECLARPRAHLTRSTGFQGH